MESTRGLAHGLGSSVVAEGIETPWQYLTLRDSGCDLGQGHLIAKPMPQAQLLKWHAQKAHGALAGVDMPAAQVLHAIGDTAA